MSAEQTTTPVEEQVVAGIRDLYDAYMAEDLERFDSHLHSGTTTWESRLPHLYSRSELDEFRELRARAGARPVVSEMRVDVLRVDVWDDTAIVAYLLTIETADDVYAGVARITDVLRRDGDAWRIVHHHAQDREADEAAADLAGIA